MYRWGHTGKQIVLSDVVIGRLERVKACLNGAARYISALAVRPRGYWTAPVPGVLIGRERREPLLEQDPYYGVSTGVRGTRGVVRVPLTRQAARAYWLRRGADDGSWRAAAGGGRVSWLWGEGWGSG